MQDSPEQTKISSSSDDTSAIRINNVSKYYGNEVAVDDVSISVSNGDFVTLLGPSGAGKTTLLHMIAGFETPTDGEIFIDGDPISDKPPYERNIGLVFQDLALFPNMTVEENIAYPLKMRRMSSDYIKQKVTEVLELVRLPEDYRSNSVTELSGGQQQRVAIARAIVYEPTLLLLDEPLSSLDKKLREEMRDELIRIHNETDLTIIHVTHNQTQALSMADKIAVLNDGELAQLNQSEDLYSSPATPFVADFIGDTTLFDGMVTTCTDGKGKADYEDITVSFETEADIAVNKSITLGVRAEHIDISPRDVVNVNSETQNTYAGTIKSVSFEGNQTQYKISLEDAPLVVQVIEPNTTNRKIYERKSNVTIHWLVDDTLVFPDS